MRVIGGRLKGRRFQPPANIPARPTTDFAKEGLFNILQNNLDFEAIQYLDLFGGTGSISYEMASRGCTQITLVEKDYRSVSFIKKQMEEFHIQASVLQMDVFEYIRHCRQQFDLIFAGPPYALPQLDQIPDLLFSQKIPAPGAWLILEHNPNHHFENHPFFAFSRNYGTTIFSIFEQP